MSVAEIANTTVTVFRGTTANRFGDPVDSDTPLYQAVPAFLAEMSQNVQDPSSPTPRTIRASTCQVPAAVGLMTTDRLYDESCGETYIVISVTRPPTLLPGVPVDTVATLKRVTASGT